MHLPTEIRGHMRKADGAPVQAKLSFGRHDPDTKEVSWEPFVLVKAKRNGSFLILGLEPGIWQLMSPGSHNKSGLDGAPRLGSLSRVVDTRKGSVEGADLVLREVTLVKLKTMRLKSPYPRAEVFDPAGLYAVGANLGRNSKPGELYLPQGSYELVTRREGVVVDRRRLEVGSEPMTLELELHSCWVR